MKDLAKILTKPYLIKEYIDNKKSILTIAKEIGCSKATILNYLKKYNINRRTISECLKGRHKITKLSNILTKLFLYQEYIMNNKSAAQIANEVGCSESVVLFNLNKYKIKIRSQRDCQENYSKILTKEFLIKEYIVNQKSTFQIAKAIGCSAETIRRYLKIYNIKMRTHSEVTIGKNNPMFGKIGKLSPNYIDGSGYEPYPSEFNAQLKRKIRKRDNYTCQGKDCNMTQEEHFIVYGRDLEIHHINHDKKNCKEYNLITLCKQCNIRANYNRDYWNLYFEQKIKELDNVYTN